MRDTVASLLACVEFYYWEFVELGILTELLNKYIALFCFVLSPNYFLGWNWNVKFHPHLQCSCQLRAAEGLLELWKYKTSKQSSKRVK